MESSSLKWLDLHILYHRYSYLIIFVVSIFFKAKP